MEKMVEYIKELVEEVYQKYVEFKENYVQLLEENRERGSLYSFVFGLVDVLVGEVQNFLVVVVGMNYLLLEVRVKYRGKYV